MSASIILTFKMTLASAYTALTDAWVLSARGRKYYCKSIQASGWVLPTAITKTKSPSEQSRGGHYFFKRWVIDILFGLDTLACAATFEIGLLTEKCTQAEMLQRHFPASAVSLTFSLLVCLGTD